MREHDSDNQFRVRPSELGQVVRIKDFVRELKKQNIQYVDCSNSGVNESEQKSHDLSSVKRFNQAIDNGVSKAIFDHLRNYLICSFLFAVGVTEFDYESGLPSDFSAYQFSAISIIILSFLLFCFNLFDGIRQISRHKYRSIYTSGLIFIYVVMAVGMIKLAVNFRAAI